jgi:host factor-I protein
MIFSMEAAKEESKQTIEPQFLSQAQAGGIRLRIGQMNKTEHEGTIRDIGRYEINLEENGRIVTLLKQEMSYLTAPRPVLTISPPQQTSASTDQTPAEVLPSKPNIQQEFLDKAIRENQFLTLYLINGQRIRANIEAYDNFTLLLKEGGNQHLYYKHSITTINR